VRCRVVLWVSIDLLQNVSMVEEFRSVEDAAPGTL